MPSLYRVALANLRLPRSPEESVELARRGIGEAASRCAQIVCFPECFVPGYRCPEHEVPAPDAGFSESAWRAVAEGAAAARIAVVLGTERVVPGFPIPSALVIDSSTGLLARRYKPVSE
jgi:predicted amidohydrolase